MNEYNIKSSCKPKKKKIWFCLSFFIMNKSHWNAVKILKKYILMIWERLKAGGEGTTEDEMVGWHHRLSAHGLSKLWEMGRTGKPGVLQSTGLQRVGYD